MSGREDFHDRRSNRVAGLRRAADRARSEGESRIATARARADCIPFGQPILVGHYSEHSDRRFRKRIEDGMIRGHADLDRADALERRAKSAEKNRAIFSDDPEAIGALREKLTALETKQARYRQLRTALNQQNPEQALLAIGVDQLTADKMCHTGDGRIPSYLFTNLGAQIRSVKARIAQLEAAEARPPHEPEQIGEVTIDEGENRVRVRFPGKPPNAVISKLKSCGFRWSPTERAWQRHASDQAWQLARQVAETAETIGGAS